MKQSLNLDIRSSIRIYIKNQYIIHIDAMHPVFCNKIVILHLKDNFELLNYVKVRYTYFFEEKERYIKVIANRWRSEIDTRVYDALMNYTVEITD